MFANMSYASTPMLCSPVFNYHHPQRCFGAQFAALLHRNPKIQRCVRELSYDPINNFPKREAGADALLVLLCLIVSRPCFLHAVFLVSRSGRSQLLACDVPFFTYSFNSPLVTNIHMGRFMNLPSIFLSNCSNLKHLHITGDLGLRLATLVCALHLPRYLIFHDGRMDLQKTQTNGLPILDLSISYFTEKGYLPMPVECI